MQRLYTAAQKRRVNRLSNLQRICCRLTKIQKSHHISSFRSANRPEMHCPCSIPFAIRHLYRKNLHLIIRENISQFVFAFAKHRKCGVKCIFHVLYAKVNRNLFQSDISVAATFLSHLFRAINETEFYAQYVGTAHSHPKCTKKM